MNLHAFYATTHRYACVQVVMHAYASYVRSCIMAHVHFMRSAYTDAFACGFLHIHMDAHAFKR